MDQRPLRELLEFKGVGDIEHPPGRDTGLVEHRLPFPGRLRRERTLDLGAQLGPICLAVLAIGEPGVVDQIFASDQPAQHLELFLPVGGDVERPVGGHRTFADGAAVAFWLPMRLGGTPG